MSPEADDNVLRADPTSPYALNFGGGTRYAFISADGLKGRFFWDCV
jgi:hypothetical protein